MPRASATRSAEKERQERQKLYGFMQEFIQLHRIDKERFTEVMKEAFLDVLSPREADRKEAERRGIYSVIVNPDTADIQILRRRQVVADDEVEDESRQIPLSEALTHDPHLRVGEYFLENIPFSELNRHQIEMLRLRLRQRLLDLGRRAIYQRYSQMIGTIITGDVLKITREELIIKHEGIELSLPKEELIPNEESLYVPKDSAPGRRGRNTQSVVKAVVKEVLDPQRTSPYRPIVILSRASPLFLETLLKQEVPEINDGIISIKKVVRAPGKRAKVLVESYDDRIDPVGACIGVKGTRIRPIVEELRGEYVDIIPHNPNIKLMILRALAPADVKYVDVYPNRRYAKVFVEPDDYARAVGEKGINVRLAEELLGYKLDIREVAEYGEEEDIELSEFRDAIEEPILAALQKEGFYTARSVLQYPIDELQKRTQIDLGTLRRVYEILQAEFEDE
ncbi:MAG: transcription termination factor NusA [Bacteroidia bacterium]|nr:transcription termination factor NusA [Bacteroidia bacterium]MDW8088629.1 transcription termination factor NusA [Bacteroidia bacterium]